MGLQEVASWYQRKIGTYDKQQWERTVEQRILHGLTHVPRKTAKLKTELIDVDLVRGSSFPKAKPKHGLLTVARLGIQRLGLLPLYWRWWIQQTSPRIYAVLLFLYMLQTFNMGLYFYCVHLYTDDTSENVSASEVLAPAFMMIVLSVVHSQIVSTHNGQPTDMHDRSRRRMKRPKRRPMPPSRIRIICCDSKSSPDTESEKRATLSEASGKFNKRVRLKRTGEEISSKAIEKNVENICPEVESENPPRIRVCFKEPADEEISVEEHEDNQRGREGTPLDDDGFESLNGNGSSENGDEPAEETLEPIHANITDATANQNKYSDIFLKCSDPNNVEKQDLKEIDRIDTNFKKCCETVKCDDNLPNVETFEEYTDINPSFNLIDLNSEKEMYSDVRATHRSDLNVCKKESGGDKEWLSSKQTPARERTKQQKRSCEKGEKLLVRGHIPQHRQSAALPRLCRTDNSSDHHDTDSEGPRPKPKLSSARRDSLLKRRRGSQNLLLSCPPGAARAEESSYNSSCCDDSEDGGDDGTMSSPGTGGSSCGKENLTEGGTTSATEWMGVTTNSEECSYSSDMDESDSHTAAVELNDHPFAWEFEQSPTVILSPSCAASDKVSCTMWENRDVKKADLSVLDISSAIIARVEAMPENMDYFYGGMIMAFLLSAVPPLCRLILAAETDTQPATSHVSQSNATMSLLDLNIQLISEHVCNWIEIVMIGAFGSVLWERTIMVIALMERFALAALFFFLLAVAERTFKQRFLYAKLFSHLTSFRRARKSELPHFRLNKVRNIKTWLSVRSYLRKRGPQRSVDMLVSAAFIITLLLLTFLIVELLKDSVRLNSQYNMEALCWCLALGAFLLRFMTLGTDINRKYCNLSVLITEQINLYLQIEQKPNKKEELMVANSVLKLAADLLKELESPFKISGLSANPYLYNITNVVILSALSGVLSEILGFKLKLHKIKIK